MYFTYTFCLFVGLLISAPWYFIRSRKYIATIKPRLGYLEIPKLKQSIWVHAVSVGEVKAVQKLCDCIRVRYPNQPLVLSTTTPTGQQLARETRGLADYVFYFPFDLPFAVRRTLNQINPRLVIIAETEIWPNFLRECKKRNIRSVLVNGRISDRSFPRYRKFRRWLKTILKDFSVLGMQSEVDRERIEYLGADPARVRVFGNLKYDVSVSNRRPDPALSDLLMRNQPLWIAASTTGSSGDPANEEEHVLRAYESLKKQHQDVKLLIAPRHPERFDIVEQLIRARGLRCLRRTTADPAVSDDSAWDVFLLDTIGELSSIFSSAHVVFIGGSLVPRGGHNVLEPAAASRAIVFGTHMENFREISALFIASGAAIQVHDADELARVVDRLLRNSDEASRLGENARLIVERNTGATQRVMPYLS
jgi:3-deoxy-D-manno-octulosonic-acid transferase